jgi:uncharacterized membrane protein
VPGTISGGAPGSLVGTIIDLCSGCIVLFLNRRQPAWRSEALRTTLWVVPSLLVIAATFLFLITYSVDRAAYDGSITLPDWVNNGSADASRQILTAIAASVITVVGLVFSITIVALSLASTQFGPRMLRNFVRDRGTQLTLGTFVATFVYAVLSLGSVSHGDGRDFVPHLSITVAIALVLIDLGVLIYFIHHVAKSIQLPEVIAGIARDLARAIEVETAAHRSGDNGVELGPSVPELLRRMDESGATIPAVESGYLQFVGFDALVALAVREGAVVRLLHRPGHFVVQGLPLATVWPVDTAPSVASALEREHATGPHRTLQQDLSLAIDQLVEIAIRALSPAVNDTFSALTCIDWLGDGLCKLAARWDPRVDHRDHAGYVRVIAVQSDFTRFVDRAFDKIRQSSAGMPAVMIRQLDALARIMDYATTDAQRDPLCAQADMILRSSERSVPEQDDRADVQRSYALVAKKYGNGTTPS